MPTRLKDIKTSSLGIKETPEKNEIIKTSSLELKKTPEKYGVRKEKQSTQYDSPKQYSSALKNIPVGEASKKYVIEDRLYLPGSKPPIIPIELLLLEDGEPLLLENEETILL